MYASRNFVASYFQAQEWDKMCSDNQFLIVTVICLQVVRDRVRVHEWLRDYDKLRSGRMHKLSFRRALDLCKFELKETEYALLEDR